MPRKKLKFGQPAPKKSKHPAVWNLVIEDMQRRNKDGIKKYGTPLQPFNGRKSLLDLYEEMLDGIVYLRQHIYETEGF